MSGILITAETNGFLAAQDTVIVIFVTLIGGHRAIKLRVQQRRYRDKRRRFSIPNLGDQGMIDRSHFTDFDNFENRAIRGGKFELVANSDLAMGLTRHFWTSPD